MMPALDLLADRAAFLVAGVLIPAATGFGAVLAAVHQRRLPLELRGCLPPLICVTLLLCWWLWGRFFLFGGMPL